LKGGATWYLHRKYDQMKTIRIQNSKGPNEIAIDVFTSLFNLSQMIGRTSVAKSGSSEENRDTSSYTTKDQSCSACCNYSGRRHWC
jgi:hypothetical protein